MNLIIENGHEIDIPETLEVILESRFKEDREYWYWFNTAFHPENRKETKERFFSMKDGDNLVCQTVFLDWIQLELMANMLILMQSEGIKINAYIIVYPSLKEQVEKYLDYYESDIVPRTEEYDDSPQLRKEFKSGMNTTMRLAFEYHNIYDMSGMDAYFDCDDIEKFEKSCPRITITEDLKVLENNK